MGDGFDGPLYRAVGCAHCNHTGYAGRLGVYEAITIDDEMRRLIGDNASEDALAEAAFARADRLAASARSAVAAGLTTLEEALRVTRQDGGHDDGARSAEHTTELQSLLRISYAVFCFKKKKNKRTQLT